MPRRRPDSEHLEELTGRQVLAVASLLKHGSIPQAVVEIGVGERQLRRWASLPAFGCEDGEFGAVEVIRYKTRKKASMRGGKAVGRQIYPLGDTVLPLFLRSWHARTSKLAGSAPSLSAYVFPVRRAKRSAEGEKGTAIDRVGERRGHSTWASPLRRDVKRAFEAAAAAGDKSVPTPKSRRWLELFDGTEDRRPLWFHNSRNAAAISAERFERLSAAAKFTGHASARMLQHYREMAGEVDVVPMLPALLPDAHRLDAVVRAWCIADGIDLELVFRAESTAEPSGTLTHPEQNEMAATTGAREESPSIRTRQGGLGEAESSAISPFSGLRAALPKLAHYQAVLHPEGRGTYCTLSRSSSRRGERGAQCAG